MRRVFYWPQARRLVYLDEKATPEFWDSHWQGEGKPPVVSPRDIVVSVTSKYLPRGARVLEGGCGRANKVQAMADAGFTAVGVDFAEGTVERARLDYPQLEIRQGDVRSLDIPDCSFDGYWSIGVIEHFWSGYGAILAEAARILNPGGLLFLTAPWLSPYRMQRARAGGYEVVEFLDEPTSFYQFALTRDEVCAQLVSHGFELSRWHGLAAEISMKEDMKSFRRGVDWLLGSRGSIVKRALRAAVVESLNPYCGHSFLAVARRNS